MPFADELGGGCCTLFRIAVGNDDAMARLRQSADDAATDAIGTTGDQRYTLGLRGVRHHKRSSASLSCSTRRLANTASSAAGKASGMM